MAPSRKIILLAALGFAFTFASQTTAAASGSCGLPGDVQLFEEAHGWGVFFYAHRGLHVIQFKLPGKHFAWDARAAAGTTQFTLDGVHYQLVFNDVDVAGHGDGVKTDEAILQRYMTWEHDYAVKMGTPLKRRDDLGSRTRPANATTPPLVFDLNRWTAAAAPEGGSAAQFALATVVDREIVTLMAIVPANREIVASFNKAIILFRDSFSFVGENACRAGVSIPSAPQERSRRPVSG